MVYQEREYQLRLDKITDDNKLFSGVPQHFWGVISNGYELQDFTQHYAEACFGLDAGPASSSGGQLAAAPAAETASGSAATPAMVDPVAQITYILLTAIWAWAMSKTFSICKYISKRKAATAFASCLPLN